MAATLRFTVEVAADQATQALKALSVASNQAGVAMKTSMASVGASSRVAAGGLMELKTSAGRARETAMFFTQALSEFGPQGQTARIALSGIVGAMMGGGGVVIALGLAQAAVRLYTAASKEQEEADRAAAAAARTRGEALKALTLETERMIRALAGETPEQAAQREKMAAAEAKIADATRRRADAAAALAQIEENFQGATAEWTAAKATYDAITAELRDAETERSRIKIQGVVQSHKQELDAEREKNAKRLEETRQSAEAEAKIRADLNDPSKWGTQYGPPEAPAADQKEFNSELEKSAALAETVGASLGSTFAQLAVGQMSAEEALKSILQLLIKEATAAAITSAINAGKSVAGTPVVGPVLAISAMGAVLAAATSMIGGMPSARGGWWDTGSYEGLAMIHKKEMVLPAREAEMVRKGAGGVTLNVAAYDARGFDRVLSNNNSALAREMRKMNRRGSM